MALFEFLKLAFPAQRRYSETRCPAYGFWSSVLHISCVNFCTESLIFIPHKIYVLPKVVRAKLPGPWEGGGCGGKKHPPNYIIWCFFFFFFFFFLGFVSWAKLPWLSLTCGWAAACQRQWGLLTFFVFSYHFIVAFCLWFRVLTMLKILSTFCMIRKGRASLPAKMGIPHRLDNKLNYLWKTAENVISRLICLGSFCSRK